MPTSLDSESGRISLFVCGSLASSLKPKERILSLSFLEAASCVCTKTSYRDSTDIIFTYKSWDNHELSVLWGVTYDFRELDGSSSYVRMVRVLNN